MRKPLLLIFANTMILIVLFCLMAQSLFIVARLASAKSVTGTVEVKRAGENVFQPIVQGEAVKAGDEVRTGKNGRAQFAWADGTRWKIEPNTRLKIERAAIDSWHKTEHTQFHLDEGKVFVRVVKPLASGSSFGIETPLAFATVRGTVWSIEVRSGQTCVGVWKGFVEVSGQGSEPQIVRPGHEAIAGMGGVQLQTANDAAFQAQSDLLRPSLEAQVELGTGEASLNGQTEAGNSLLLNGQPLAVLNNGVFLRRAALKTGHNQWTITATDKHGESSSVCRAVEFDGKTATMGVCR